MMEDNKKAITVSFVAVALLTGFTVHLLLQLLAQNFTVVARAESNDLLSNGIPVVCGLILFAVLQLNATVQTFSEGVISELKKVVWPSRKDTGLMTVVVVITLLISGVIVGVYDSVWAYIINAIIK